MPVGVSLHIGINRIDPKHYAGTAGRLTGAESDAIVMQSIAKSMGFDHRIFLTQNAKRDTVLKLISNASQDLRGGDLFFISYSGHGGYLPNLNNDPESVGYDQTWCLFDAQIVDDELKYLWTSFRPGVRILVVTDSCFSGSIIMFHGGLVKQNKILDQTILKRTYSNNKDFYDKILIKSNVSEEQIKASVLLLASCQDNQKSIDSTFNGVFTKHLSNVWNDGKFNGNYQTFIDEISTYTPLTQVPKLSKIGTTDIIFLNSQPFKI